MLTPEQVTRERDTKRGKKYDCDHNIFYNVALGAMCHPHSSHWPHRSRQREVEEAVNPSRRGSLQAGPAAKVAMIIITKSQVRQLRQREVKGPDLRLAVHPSSRNHTHQLLTHTVPAHKHTLFLLTHTIPAHTHCSCSHTPFLLT